MFGKDHLVAIFDAIVESLGQPSAKPEVIDNPNGRGGYIALSREGYTLHVMPGPQRQLRTHTFADLRSFAEFLNRHATRETTEILMNETTTKALLEPRDPLGCRVSCDMRFHPRFDRWKRLLGKAMTQREFLGLVIAARDDFGTIKTSKGEPIATEGEMFATNLMRLAINKEGSYQCDIDERGTIRFSAGTEKTTVQGQLPSRFTIHVPVFRGIEKALKAGLEEPLYPLEILLELDVEEKPMFTLVAPAIEMVVLDALMDAAEYLRSRLDKGFLVSLGNASLHVVE
jgi:hypothetical protein